MQGSAQLLSRVRIYSRQWKNVKKSYVPAGKPSWQAVQLPLRKQMCSDSLLSVLHFLAAPGKAPSGPEATPLSKGGKV